MPRSGSDRYAEAGRRSAAGAALLLAVLFSAGVARAAPASCHCFRDRSFDPARPAAADPYFLVAARNALIAVAFGVPRRSLVGARMAGTSADDLWVAHFAARRLGLDGGELLAARGSAASWEEVLRGPKVPPGRLGERMARLLAEGASDETLAAGSADETLAALLGADPSELSRIRAEGAPTGEVVLAALLARRTGRAVASLRAEVLSGSATWGGLLAGSGLRQDNLEGEIRKLAGSPAGGSRLPAPGRSGEGGADRTGGPPRREGSGG